MKKASGIEITVTSNGEVIGRITCKEFRDFMNDQTSFIPALVKRFNEGKASIGEPERVEQTLV